MNNKDISIYITLVNGHKLGITKNNHLVIETNYGNQADLGLATITCMDRLIEYITQLKIHAVDYIRKK